MPGLKAEIEAPETGIRARAQEWQLGAPGTGLVWLDDVLVASSGDGRLYIHAAGAADPDCRKVHEGAILSIAADPANSRVLTGGDDGRVVATGGEDSRDLLSRPGRWIEAVAVSRRGQIAAAIGKSVILWRLDATHSFDMPSTAAALAFDSKGDRLAVAHYGGVTVIDPAHPKRAPRRLAWKGSHIGVTFSPDGRFVVSVMSENALHGWRLKDGADMAMSGYPTRPRSVCWSADGRLLASSGADGAIVWSFAGRDGPMGTSAVTLGERRIQLTALAWHPEAPMLALGYADGAVQLCRAEDDAMLPLRAPDNDPIEHIRFSGADIGVLSKSGKLTRAALSP
jgi:WD40 repeat protein